MKTLFTINKIGKTVLTIKVIMLLAVLLTGGYFYTGLLIDTNNNSYNNFCNHVSEQLVDIHQRIK